ncbi:PAS domain S-box protein [Verrucomicrobia bacterium S94]|nr:PAS domain S-box protein [Verrucomicrobia bacterium S94]
MPDRFDPRSDLCEGQPGPLSELQFGICAVCRAEVDAIYGRTASEILPENISKASHMEDLRVLARGTSAESEGWTSNADGEDVYLETVKIPYLESAAGSTGMISISRDLTRRMQMEQEMRRLAVAVEQSSESIIITDVSGNIQYVNAAFENTSGYTHNEVLGRKTNFLKSGKLRAQFYEELWSTISRGEPWSGEFINRKKDGSIYIEESVIYPIRGEGNEMINYVAIGRDITEEREIEKYMRQQQKMNAIGALAGGISHDFNNILTAILGYVALCMNTVDEESKAYGYLKEIVKAGDRATKLVRQILTFSRQEEQEFRTVDLQPVVEDSLNMVQTTMKKNITVKQNIDPACGAILGDATQIQQVLINLCTNAAHALGKTDQGILSVSLQEVEIAKGHKDEKLVDLEPGKYACITVSDSGCGMPPEVVERIFEPYFTTKKKGEGTGFGLSIVHGIVRKHRGKICVESEEGLGTTFTIYIPLLGEAVPAEKESVDLSEPSGAGRILFVDDDEAILSMGREMLESFGYEVVSAPNGRQALEAFRRSPETFDMVVTDYSMPEINGHELIQQILKIRKDIPAILCSGYMEKVDGEDLSSLGHSGYVAKPVDWRELGRTIQRYISEKT